MGQVRWRGGQPTVVVAPQHGKPSPLIGALFSWGCELRVYSVGER